MMPQVQQLVATLGALLQVLLLVGLLVTRRIRLCRTFGLFVLALLVGNRLATWWPGQFHTQQFWILKQGIYAVLKVGVALSLAAVAFMEFPRARRIARLGIVAVAVLGAGWVALGPNQSYTAWVTIVAPRMDVTGGLCMLVVLGVAYWYRLPLISWHWTIILGFLVAQTNATAFSSVIRYAGWSHYWFCTIFSSVLGVAVTGWWAFGAWRSAGVRVGAEQPAQGRVRA